MNFVKFFLFLVCASSCNTSAQKRSINIIGQPKIVHHFVDLQKQKLQFYSTNENGQPYSNIGNLKHALEKKKQHLVFAMNGGMFNKNLTAQGLYIENGQLLSALDTTKIGYGNFYLQPNGVFYINKQGKASICKTENLAIDKNLQYATQSGPLLVVDGDIHPKLTKGSKNLHIRNGVGLLPDGNLLFAISKEPINFFDFATFFKNNSCNYALYLDGFVSKMYLPQKKQIQLDGQFGIIIAEIEE